MKILIAVPTFENIMPDAYKSIWDMDKAGADCVFEYVRGYDVARARNIIAHKAIEMDTDYVLMVDNDMTIPKDALVNLLDDPKEICLGYYAHRSTNNEYTGLTSICKLGEYNYTRQFNAKEIAELKAKGVKKFQIHGGGMGCALIKTSLFKRLQFPYFKWENYNSGYCLSEDLYLCENCRKAKVPVYSDTRVGCGHLLRKTFWPE